MQYSLAGATVRRSPSCRLPDTTFPIQISPAPWPLNTSDSITRTGLSTARTTGRNLSACHEECNVRTWILFLCLTKMLTTQFKIELQMPLQSVNIKQVSWFQMFLIYSSFNTTYTWSPTNYWHDAKLVFPNIHDHFTYKRISTVLRQTLSHVPSNKGLYSSTARVGSGVLVPFPSCQLVKPSLTYPLEQCGAGVPGSHRVTGGIAVMSTG